MSLYGMQSQFWSLMRQPVGLGNPQAAAELFRSNRMSPEKAVDVYRRMYWFRQQEAIAECFPRVLRAMGRSAFECAARSYLEHFPSQFPELERLGLHFPDFLTQEGWPVLLSDLAHLELGRTRAFLTPNVTALGLAEVALHPRFSLLKLNFTPSFQLLRLHPLTFQFWENPERKLTSEEAKHPRRPLVVSRQGFSVSHEWVDEVEAISLEAAFSGSDMSALCSLFIQQHKSPEQAMMWVSHWFSRGWIESVTL